jgi:hypothetical protein
MPDLQRHFEAQDFTLDMVMIGWFQTLMLHLRSAPPVTLLRLWDTWLVTGDPQIFIKASLAIIELSKEKLLELDFDGMVEYLQSFPDSSVLEPNVLLPAAEGIQFDEGELMYFEQKVRSKEGLEVPNASELLLRPGNASFFVS